MPSPLTLMTFWDVGFRVYSSKLVITWNSALALLRRRGTTLSMWEQSWRRKRTSRSRSRKAEFAKQLLPLAPSPALWTVRQKPLSGEEKLLCQCKMGELCWLATVSRPDICARLAQLASKVKP